MCEQSESDFDNVGYTKSLEKLVTMSEKEYYVQFVDINRHQIVVARTILWLLVIIIGFDIALMEWIYNKLSALDDKVVTLTPIYFCLILSIISSVSAFYFSVMSIPAFGGYLSLYRNSWAEYSNSSFKHFEEQGANVEAYTLNRLLERLDKACKKGHSTNRDRAIKLRTSSILLIASIILVAIGFITFSFKYYL